MKKLFFALCLVFTIFPAYGETADYQNTLNKYKEMARPYIEKYLGESVATSWLGEKRIVPLMPPLPELSSEVLKLESVDESKVGKPIANKETREKYDYLFLKELFKAVRAEDAPEEEFNKWYNTLVQGGSREGVYQGLVRDNIYGGLENQDHPVNDGVISFTVPFMKKFVNIQTSKEGLEGVNFYLLKREVTDKAMAMADALANKDPIFVYQWYGILSSDLASSYPRAMSNDVRKNDDASFHANWASSVPYQHLKSELMIKINMVMNSLY